MALLRLQAASGAASALSRVPGVSVADVDNARGGEESGGVGNARGGAGGGVVATAGEARVVDMVALGAVRERYQRHDATREEVIKRCREPQKVAKSSIYALHRGEPDKAAALLNSCAKGLNAIHAEALASSPR